MSAAKNKTPVILVHGIHCGGWAWRYVVPLLQERGYEHEAARCYGQKRSAAQFLHDGRSDQRLHERRSLLDSFPKAKWLLADYGYDA